MKSVWLGLSFFVSVTAFAYPNIGDRVELEGSSKARDGAMVPLVQIKEVTSHKKKSKKPWIVREEEKRNGVSDVDNEKEKVLFSPEQFSELMANCASRQGTVEKVKVPAGEFNTCRMVTEIDHGEKEETWYGDVPFGIVKKVERESENSVKESLELKVLRLGK